MKNKALSDEKLYELCEHYGKLVLVCRRKFAGLLPEVNKRRLYRQKGFYSIFEFASKLAGMSREQVKRILSLNERFEDKPALKEMLVEGKASVNKLARIVSIATAENQEFMAEQVKILPKRAVETLVRDIRHETLYMNNSEDQKGLFETKESCKPVPGHKIEDLKISEEVIGKLIELQNKGLDIDKLLQEFLEKRTEKIERKKEEIVKKLCDRDAKVSRYIPSEVRRVIQEEHGTKCAVPSCKKQSEIVHHTTRFSLSHNHNPNFLAPLCNEHHILAHAADMEVLKRIHS